MANLTIVVDDQLLQAARVKALQQGTSVNEICREAIARFADSEADRAARIDRLLKLADQIAAQPGPLWPGREALYEEMLATRKLR